jgi:hypothetical protein
VKKPWVFFVFLAAAAPGWAEYPFPDIVKKFELSLSGGLAIPRLRGSTQYADSWNHDFLTQVRERTAIEVTAGRPPSVEVGLAYFWSPNVGVQLAAGFQDADVGTAAFSEIHWTWSPQVGNGSFSRSTDWRGTGRLRTIPISLNLIVRIEGPRLGIFVSGGPTVFFSSFSAETAFGFGFTKTDPPVVPAPKVDQFVDALGVGLELVDRSWNALGANVAVGAVYRLGDSLGLTLEGRFFAGPKKIFRWDFVLGEYDGLYFSGDYPILRAVPFTAEDVTFIGDRGTMTELTVNPSFFRLAAGIKFAFGD